MYWRLRLVAANCAQEPEPEKTPWPELARRSFAVWPRAALAAAWISARRGLVAGQLKSETKWCLYVDFQYIVKMQMV